jgi:hypothetical protein
MGDQLVAWPLPTERQTDIHALSGIQTHDPSVSIGYFHLRVDQFLYAATACFLQQLSRTAYRNEATLKLDTLYIGCSERRLWILILLSATSCKTAASLADKNACSWPVLLAHIVYFFH